ncbi:leucine-rich repeat-containing protein 59 [Ostrea edulis]|uniref:leucine-rich repeat-containing protein 59 n=1 Tax=Ostrea edulis TaxID=37623 RepID=UPI0020947E75|nr:leucine-rich repeat-containing protein 59 [Ostrea edulis]
MPKDNLRDKLEGNELDLSLNNLDTVPVKELAAIPKATRLDLSCNQLTSLPDNFSSLTHLVKIDLSKNKLTELPHNFGNLQSLQHLDLLGNQLVLLPISFYKLTKLKWLDLKDNPLQSDLKKIAGDCLDENQCKKCATQVLKYLRDYNSELERLKQKKLKEEREEKQRLKNREEAERERVRQERKQKKLENRKRKDFMAADEATSSVPAKNDGNKETSLRNGKTDKRQKSTDAKSGMSWLTILAVLMVVLGVLIGVCYTVCQDNKGEMCVQYWEPAKTGVEVFIVNIKTNTQELTEKSIDTLHKYYSTYFGNDHDNTKIPPNKKTPENTAQT